METGPEMEILDNTGHQDGKRADLGRLAYDLLPCLRRGPPPCGEELRDDPREGEQDRALAQRLQVVECDLTSDDYKKAHAASNGPRCPTSRRGPRASSRPQDYGDPVWFRDIKKCELK